MPEFGEFGEQESHFFFKNGDHAKFGRLIFMMVRTNVKWKINVKCCSYECQFMDNNISKITGKNDIDDILNIIFKDFCIGK